MAAVQRALAFQTTAVVVLAVLLFSVEGQAYAGVLKCSVPPTTSLPETVEVQC